VSQKKIRLFYILDEDNNVVPLEEDRGREYLYIAEAFFSNSRRIVARTQVGKNVVSTVFLCIRHSYEEDQEPDLFETVVFDENGAQVDFCEKDRAQLGSLLLLGFDMFGSRQRYKTWKDAEDGHKRVVQQFVELSGEDAVDLPVLPTEGAVECPLAPKISEDGVVVLDEERDEGDSEK